MIILLLCCQKKLFWKDQGGKQESSLKHFFLHFINITMFVALFTALHFLNYVKAMYSKHFDGIDGAESFCRK